MNWVESLEAYPPWQRYIVYFVIIGTICALFYFMKYKDAKEEIARQDVTISELDVEINKGLAMKDQLEDFRQQVFHLREEMRGAAEVLGDRPNVDQLVKQMEALATQCGLRVERFQPVPERTHDFYGEVPISMSLFGGFHELGAFFDNIANEHRIMNITDLQVRGIYQLGGPSISAECYLTAFWYLQ
jgi:type IV pilus assembly protein PilO